MRIIDAFTGRDVDLGDVLRDPSGNDWQLMEIRDKAFFDAKIRVKFLKSGKQHWVPLQVRFLHPKYFFQRIGFVPT